MLRPLAREVQDRVRLLSEVEPMVDFLRTDDVEIDEASWQRSVVKLGDRAGAMLDAAAGGWLRPWEREAVEAALSEAALAAGFGTRRGTRRCPRRRDPYGWP